MGYLRKMYGKRSPDFIKGVIAGIIEFAWWKDGVQFVGSCGTTLEEAVQETINDLAENPEDFDVKKIVNQGYILEEGKKKGGEDGKCTGEEN